MQAQRWALLLAHRHAAVSRTCRFPCQAQGWALLLAHKFVIHQLFLPHRHVREQGWALLLVHTGVLRRLT